MNKKLFEWFYEYRSIELQDFEKKSWVYCDPVFGKPEKYLFLIGEGE
jgi:hypothetical protein